MIRTKVIFATLLILFLLVLAGAQSPRRRTTPTKPAAAPTPATAAPQPSPSQPVNPSATAIAVVNDTTISASDIEDQVAALINRDEDRYLRDYYADPAKAIREARQRAVDAKIASLLIAAEAKKRGKTTDQIIDTEITSKI